MATSERVKPEAVPAKRTPGRPAIAAPGLPLNVAHVLALQKTAGNQAVAHHLAHAAAARTAPNAQAAKSTREIAFVRESGLHLRQHADQQSHSIAGLPHGRRVHVLDRQGDWMKVVCEEGHGYVYRYGVDFPSNALIAQDPAVKLIRVDKGETFWELVKEQYGISGDESSPDQNVDHFINAIRAVNKPEAFDVTPEDGIGQLVPGRDAANTKLKAGYDLWIPSLPVAARMNVPSGTVTGEVHRLVKTAEHKVHDLKKACGLAGHYIPQAVADRLGENAAGLVGGLEHFAIEAAGILGVSTAAGALIGSLVGGAGTAPGAALGFEAGMLILRAYGLYGMVEAIVQAAQGVGQMLGDFIGEVWSANGDPKKLDHAAKTLAGALGVLVAGIVAALVDYIARRSVKAIAETRFGQAVGEDKLEQWEEKREAPKETPEERRARLREKARQRDEAKRATELEELYRNAKRKLEDLSAPDREWVEADPRHKELAYDPAERGWTPGSVEEAKAILVAEAEGLIDAPVTREIHHTAPDFLDGKGKGVDHYAPRATNIGLDEDSLIKKLTNQDYEVYLDGSYITPDQEAAIINGVRQRLIRAGKPPTLLNRVVSGRAPEGRYKG